MWVNIPLPASGYFEPTAVHATVRWLHLLIIRHKKVLIVSMWQKFIGKLNTHQSKFPTIKSSKPPFFLLSFVPALLVSCKQTLVVLVQVVHIHLLNKSGKIIQVQMLKVSHLKQSPRIVYRKGPCFNWKIPQNIWKSWPIKRGKKVQWLWKSLHS